jgi:hypothetical protein
MEDLTDREGANVVRSRIGWTRTKWWRKAGDNKLGPITAADPGVRIGEQLLLNSVG